MATARKKEPGAPKVSRAAQKLFTLVKERPLRSAFAERLLEGLVDMTEELDETALANALGASSPYETFLRALANPDAVAVLEGKGPLKRARLRGLGERQRILESEGGVWSAKEVADHLGISRQAVDKRRKAGTLIALPRGRHGFGYPAWEFGREGTLRGLETVLSDLGGHDDWMKAVFMLGPNPRLGSARPLDLLRKGQDLKKVKTAASAWGEHGSD